MNKSCVCGSNGYDWESVVQFCTAVLFLAVMFVVSHAILFSMNSLAIKWRTGRNLSWKAIESRRCKCPWHKKIKPAVEAYMENRKGAKNTEEGHSEKPYPSSAGHGVGAGSTEGQQYELTQNNSEVAESRTGTNYFLTRGFDSNTTALAEASLEGGEGRNPSAYDQQLDPGNSASARVRPVCVVKPIVREPVASRVITEVHIPQTPRERVSSSHGFAAFFHRVTYRGGGI